MNNALKQLGRFTRDLLEYDEQLIKFGRDGFVRESFDKGFIAIDSIGPAIRIGRGNRFNGETETHTITARIQAPCTLNFYGTTDPKCESAYDRAARFMLMIQSQRSFDLQYQFNISVYLASSITDVKALTGQQYGENFEIAVNIQYNESVDLSVKRIDTAQVAIYSENSQELAP